MLPHSHVFGGSTLVYDGNSAIQDWLRQTSDQNGILQADYAQYPQISGLLLDMAGNDGRDHVRPNWSNIVQKMIDSLTLGNYSDSLVVRNNGDVELSFTLTNSSLCLIFLLK